MIQRTLTKIFDTYKTDFPKTLLHTGVLTFALSSAAQIGAIKNNKNLAPAQKDYLTKQEIAEGSVNLVLFYTVCQYIKKQAEKLTSNCTILPTETRKLLAEMKTPESTDALEFLTDKLNTVNNPETLKKIHAAINDIKLLKPFVSNIAGFTAGFLACNIITPFSRNVIANHFYKKDKRD